MSWGYNNCHAGKWHLNSKFNSPEQPQPNDHRYDHWIAYTGTNQHVIPNNYVHNGEAVGPMKGAAAGLMATEAIEWLKNREEQKQLFLLHCGPASRMHLWKRCQSKWSHTAISTMRISAHDRSVRTEGGTLNVHEREK